jgi:hypothetical protein
MRNDGTGDYAFVGGGVQNTGSGECSAVVGGCQNYTTNCLTTIGGGHCNRIVGSSNVGGQFIGGGWSNYITRTNNSITMATTYCGQTICSIILTTSYYC